MRPALVALAVCCLCCPVLLRGSSWNERSASAEWRRPRTFGHRTRDSSEGQFGFADTNFAAAVEGALARLSDAHVPILVHARSAQVMALVVVERGGRITNVGGVADSFAIAHVQGRDLLLFLRENGENVTASLELALFDNLKAISHFPVSAVATLSSALADPENSSSALPPDVRSDLEQLQRDIARSTDLINSGAFVSEEQATRQLEITSTTVELVSGVLQKRTPVTTETLSDFVGSIDSQLKANARDAVLDYLTVTNSTLTHLLNNGSITDTEWQALNVVIAVDPFTENSSFLYQYYEQLLASYERVTVLPMMDTFHNTGNISSASILSVSDTFLTDTLTTVFYGGQPYSLPHDALSNAAKELVCSEEFFLSTCTTNNTTVYSSGFQTTVQRVYVVIITFLTTVLAVLLTILGCIASEEKKMKRERRNTNTTYENSPVLTVSSHSSYET